MESFIIERQNFERALLFLSSFCYKKIFKLCDVTDVDVEDIDNPEMVIDTTRIEKPIFTNIIFLRCCGNGYVVSVYNDGLRIQSTFHTNENCEDWGFNLCFDADKLLSLIKYTDCQTILFSPIPFWGMNLYNSSNNKYIGCIQCVSDIEFRTELYEKKFNGILQDNINIDKHFIYDTLSILPKYCGNPDFVSDWRGCVNYIIKNGECISYGSQGYRLGLLKRSCEHSIDKCNFSLPVKFADSFLKILDQRENDYINIEYRKGFVRFVWKGKDQKFTIDAPIIEIKDLSNALQGEPEFDAKLNKKDLVKEIDKCKLLSDYPENLVIHLTGQHCVYYFKDEAINHSFIEFTPLDYVNGEGTISLDISNLEILLEDIDTEELNIIKKNNIYILSSKESLDKERLRMMTECLYNKDDFDKELSKIKKFPAYIEMINRESEHIVKECSQATIAEMRAEAISRMRKVIEYSEIIDYFEETDLPQVYEPPYGASYSLEDDEIESVRKIESTRKVKVWGIIRCYMPFNGQEVTVDCMLHVSSNKDGWKQEREDLFNGLPYVYTVMKEFPITDHGSINIYKSAGGTLLRK